MFKVPPYQLLSSKPFKSRSYVPNLVRPRTKLSSSQLKVLEQTFNKDSNPLLAIRRELGKQLGLPQRAIQIWFQNRRAKSLKLKEKTHELTYESSVNFASLSSNISLSSSPGPSFSTSTISHESISSKPRVSEFWLTTMSQQRAVPF